MAEIQLSARTLCFSEVVFRTAGTGTVLGNSWSGFGCSRDGRRRFGEFVEAHAAQPRDPEISGERVVQRRAQLRDACGWPIEISSPVATDEAAASWSHVVQHREWPVAPPRWPGNLRLLLDAVAEESGVAVPLLLSRSRMSRVVCARRLFVAAGIAFLRRRVGEVAAVLAIADPSVSEHLRSTTPDVLRTAQRVAQRLWDAAARSSVTGC